MNRLLLALVLTLAFAFLSSAAAAEVIIYSGSATEHRPGAQKRTARAFLVMARDGFPFRVAVVLTGGLARPPFIAGASLAENSGRGDTKFRFVGATIDEAPGSGARLGLASPLTRDPALLRNPRRYTGSLLTTKFLFSAWTQDFNDIPQGERHVPDYSDLSLVFSFDARRTKKAVDAGMTVEAAAAALQSGL